MDAFLTTLASQLSGASVDQIHVSLRQPMSYQSNCLYDIRFDTNHWIAKEFLQEAEFLESPAREIQTLDLLKTADIAPQPIHLQPHTTTNRPIVIYEYMEGEMWDRRIPTEADLKGLADIWTTIHAFTREDLWLARGANRSLDQHMQRWHAALIRYQEWATLSFPSGLAGAELVIKEIQRHQRLLEPLDSMKPTLLFCRADPRFANVIQRPGQRLGLVDWEDAGLRDPARDIADLILHPNNEDLVTQHQWDTFLHPYLAARRPHDPQLQARIDLYLMGAALFWLTGLINYGVNCAPQGSLSGWQINGMPANERLRRYLAYSVAGPQGDFQSHLDSLHEMQFFPDQLTHGVGR